MCSACSTSKDSFFRREYHTLTTKYNVLFNGKEAFEVGSQILKQAHEDNFFELLPVEPISLLGEDVNLPTIVPGFTRAEEKADARLYCSVSTEARKASSGFLNGPYMENPPQKSNKDA